MLLYNIEKGRQNDRTAFPETVLIHLKQILKIAFASSEHIHIHLRDSQQS